MRRMHLLEIEDQSWCPAAIRDGGTDWLGFMANTTRVFDGIIPKLRRAMGSTQTQCIVDICSGGGGPWPSLAPALTKGAGVQVLLSDLYPNVEALRRVAAVVERGVDYCDRSIDATNVPEELEGVRTLFNSFHHFPPPLARAILADAVRKRRPIAVFEGIDRRWLGLVAVVLQLPFVLLLTPFVRPLRWSRFLFTYLVPLIPLLILFDGTVSMLRVYDPQELRELVDSIEGADAFDWDIGTTPIKGLPVGITHLVGVPRAHGSEP